MFLKPYIAKHPEWPYQGPNVTVPTPSTNALGMRVLVRPINPKTGQDAWNKVSKPAMHNNISLYIYTYMFCFF